MSKQPMISVIVPIYHVESYLNQCIDSILHQTYENLQVILVDDGSPDNCGAICDSYQAKDSRVNVIHQKNAGVGAARNAALDAVQGEWIAFVDGDDYIDSQMYEKMIEAVGTAPIVFCRFVYEYADKKQYRQENNLTKLQDRPFDYKLYSDESGTHIEADTLVCDRVFGSVCRSLFRKDIIEANHIRFSDKVKIAEDRLFLLEYVMYCEKAAIADAYYYHYRMTNITSATAMAFGKYDPKLEQRSEYLARRQTELAEKNQFLSPDEKSSFIIKTKLSAISEVVQNEIRFCKDYRKHLHKIFSAPFFRQSLGLKELSFAYKTFGTKKALYYGMIKCRFWKLIAKRIL